LIPGRKLKTVISPEALLLRLEAIGRGGLQVIPSKTHKLPEQKDTHQKPLPKNFAADFMASIAIIVLLILMHKVLGKIPPDYYRK
jgi:hypothetical protein